MFLLNQIGTESIKVETINKIVAANPRYDERIPPEANEKRFPHVIAMTEYGEVILGEYESIVDCKVAINYVTFLINRNMGNIYMPKRDEVKFISRKMGDMKGKSTADLARDILNAITSSSSDRKGGII